MFKNQFFTIFLPLLLVVQPGMHGIAETTTNAQPKESFWTKKKKIIVSIFGVITTAIAGGLLIHQVTAKKKQPSVKGPQQPEPTVGPTQPQEIVPKQPQELVTKLIAKLPKPGDSYFDFRVKELIIEIDKADPNQSFENIPIAQTLLFEAINRSDKDLLELLAKHKVSVNAQNTHGQTPLTSLSSMRRTENPGEIIDVLIKYGADINASDQFNTPLLEAVSSNNVKAIDALLSHGADINSSRSVGGNTPLIYAIMLNKDPKITSLLIQHGADPNKSTGAGTPIRIAAGEENPEYLQRLLNEAGMKINAKDINYALQLAKYMHPNNAKIIEDYIAAHPERFGK